MSNPTTLPLFNHLIAVRKSGAPATIAGLPLDDGSDAVPFSELHDKCQVVCDGEEHYAVPVDLAVAWLVKHKGDYPSYDTVTMVFRNRNISVNTVALDAGETAPTKLLKVNHVDACLTTDGPNPIQIIPLDLLAMGRIFWHHHRFKDGPKHPKYPSGGSHSEKAIVALEDFLTTVIGIKPNHAAIQSHPLFCQDCGPKAGVSK